MEGVNRGKGAQTRVTAAPHTHPHPTESTATLTRSADWRPHGTATGSRLPATGAVYYLQQEQFIACNRKEAGQCQQLEKRDHKTSNS